MSVFFFFFYILLSSIYNFLVMTNLSYFQFLCLILFLFYHHNYSYTWVCFYFILIYQLFISLSLLYFTNCDLLLYIWLWSIFYFFDSKLHNKIIPFLTNFLFFDFFFTPIPSLFLLCFSYFLPLCFSKILLIVPLHAYPLLFLLIIFFFHYFCHCNPTFLRSFLKIWCLACYFWYLLYKCMTNCSITSYH